MVGGHLVEFATLLVQADPGALAVLVVVRHAHPHNSRDAGEGVDHRGDQSAVAQAHQVGSVDAVQKRSRFRGGEDRGFTAFDDVAGSPDGRSGVSGHDLADDEPIEEHPDGGQVLFDGGRGAGVFLDVGGDVEGLDAIQG